MTEREYLIATKDERRQAMRDRRRSEAIRQRMLDVLCCVRPPVEEGESLDYRGGWGTGGNG
jgi:hypothetical protein